MYLNSAFIASYHYSSPTEPQIYKKKHPTAFEQPVADEILNCTHDEMVSKIFESARLIIKNA